MGSEDGGGSWLARANRAGTLPSRLTMIWAVSLVAGFVRYLVEEAGGDRAAQTAGAAMAFVALAPIGFAALMRRDARLEEEGKAGQPAAERDRRTGRIALIAVAVGLGCFVLLALVTRVWEFLWGAGLAAAGLACGLMQERRRTRP